MTYPVIDNASALAEFCERAAAREMIAVDTEFIWRDTYYPRFALLQIAWDGDNCALIDPLAIEDRTVIVSLMENPSVKKIFHDGYNDIPIIERWAGCHVCNIGDTIVAAGFANLTARMSLAKLFASQLGIVISKAETQSDWLRRPLTEAQLKYAGNDVAQLVALYEKLLEKVDSCGNMDFYNEEMLQREQPGYYGETPVRESWKRISRPQYLRFTKQDIAVLCELAAWRESTARRENKPRNSVFKDEWLLQAAIKHPYTREDVEAIPGIWSKAVKLRGDEVAKVVSAAMKLSADEWPDMREVLYDWRIMKQRCDRISSLLNKRAEARGIDPLLFGGIRAVKELVIAANTPGELGDARLMNGWRHKLLTPAIDEIAEEYTRRRV